MDTYIIQETSIWGDAYRATSAEDVLRCGKKRELLQTAAYPFLDHFTIYAFKPRKQRGPPRERQTFIVSYAYVYDEYIGTKETDFINELLSIDLRFYKEPCIFRGKQAYKILILDTEISLDEVVQFIGVPK